MRLMNSTAILVVLAGFAFLPAANAQDTQQNSADAAEAVEPKDDSQSAESQDALLTQAELETLVAPVALYPDTLLIQILVASTYPLEVVKGAQYLEDNGTLEGDALKDGIEAEGLDPSVEVLATAFPTVLTEMSEHLKWTETTGTAMLAQSDDVMNAVQTLRNQAIETGALVTDDHQVVETDAQDNVVVTPADPQVVYVPQYEPDSVWGDVGDALLTGVIVWGVVAVIDDIFDDDDDWYRYWGCRNCGGWGGRPIIHNPDIDIDIDGDVNIGNGNDIGWKPDRDKQSEAKKKVADHRREDGDKLPIDSTPDRGDQLRKDLSDRTGAKDISKGDQAVSKANKAADAVAKGDAAPAKSAAKPEAPAAKPAAKAKEKAAPKKAAPKAQATPKAVKERARPNAGQRPKGAAREHRKKRD